LTPSEQENVRNLERLARAEVTLRRKALAYAVTQTQASPGQKHRSPTKPETSG
jgi:hypothetical protein